MFDERVKLNSAASFESDDIYYEDDADDEYINEYRACKICVQRFLGAVAWAVVRLRQPSNNDVRAWPALVLYAATRQGL